MVYTKEEFKKLWESDETGGGITNEDCADCAREWGLYAFPKSANIQEVVYRVCEAAGVRESDMPYDPFYEKDNVGEHTVTEDFAWEVYNLINRWKAGEFGEYPLQDVLDKEL